MYTPPPPPTLISNRALQSCASNGEFHEVIATLDLSFEAATQSDSSEVLPPLSVAVAVMKPPGKVPSGPVKTALPAASVVTG